MLAAVHGHFDEVFHVGNGCNRSKHIPNGDFIEVFFTGFVEELETHDDLTV